MLSVKIVCRRCGGPLQGREGRYNKYFLRRLVATVSPATAEPKVGGSVRGFDLILRPLQQSGSLWWRSDAPRSRPTVAGSGGVFLARPAFDAFHRIEALKAYWFVSLAPSSR